MGLPFRDNPSLLQKMSNSKQNDKVLVSIVVTELGSVLAAMRCNSRWMRRYDDQPEHHLVRSLKNARRSVFSWDRKPWSSVNPCLYLAPFLEVICSDETGALITGAALSSVYKILSSNVFDNATDHIDEAMHAIVESVTSCKFEVTDPASEEAVLTKILQVLLCCMKDDLGTLLSHKDVLNVVNTCFRLVDQSSSKSELLQQIARHTMQELIRAIFLHLFKFDPVPGQSSNILVTLESGAEESQEAAFSNGSVNYNGASYIDRFRGSRVLLGTKPAYGLPCLVEIFSFLCSLLSIEDANDTGIGFVSVIEDVPQFALGLINSAIEYGGHSFEFHINLIELAQDGLFWNLMQMGFSPNPVVLSVVCSTVLSLYSHLHKHIKLQLEAFFLYVLMPLARGKSGILYQHQEVAMESLVDFCHQGSFLPEIYANFDCDIARSNLFEDIANLLCKSAFPVNSPLQPMHVLALEGLLAIIHGMANRTDHLCGVKLEAKDCTELNFVPFWSLKCDNYSDPKCWVEFVRHRKLVKCKLMNGVEHFNRDMKKGLEFLQSNLLLPQNLDPATVACFLRYTPGLDKKIIGDYLGDRDDFHLEVLMEFVKTFDFTTMSLDAALRIFLESFWLPGEAQKIERILDAFAARYFEQCAKEALESKDSVLVLAYAIIILNTDQHSTQVKKKMTEEDFIRNLRKADTSNKDFPRDMLSQLYHSVIKEEIRTSFDAGAGIPEMTHSRWMDLLWWAGKSPRFVECGSASFFDYDMFAIISGPAVAAISVVFDYAEDEQVLQACADGFLAVAKVSASFRLNGMLDDLVISLCKFTTLLNPSASMDEAVVVFGSDSKACLAVVTVFTIANRFGDQIQKGWRNVVDCILRLHKLGILPSLVAVDDSDNTRDQSSCKQPGTVPSLPVPSVVRRPSSGLISRVSKFLLLDEPVTYSTEQQAAAHQRATRTVEACHIGNIVSDSKFLQAESLLHFAKALIWAAGIPQKVLSQDDEDTAIFCLELLIAVTLNNRDRIMTIWQGVYELMAGIVQNSTTPCLLVEKTVFGLLQICQRLLPYKENIAEELLRSLQLILRLDPRVADALYERITQDLVQLVRANAGLIKSPVGWRTVVKLLSITARHPEASEYGFEGLYFIMHDITHLCRDNFAVCIDAARAFAEAYMIDTGRSLKALDLIAGSIECLVQWSKDSPTGVEANDSFILADIWISLGQGLVNICVEQNEEVRNHALLSLQNCLSASEAIHFPPEVIDKCFKEVIFVLLDDLLDIALNNSPKEYHGMDISLQFGIKLLSKLFLLFLNTLVLLPNFDSLWFSVLGYMKAFMKARLRGRGRDKLRELIPELLKNMLLILHSKRVLIENSIENGTLWQTTWQHVQDISPALQPSLLLEVSIGDMQCKGALKDPKEDGSPSGCSEPLVCEVPSVGNDAVLDVVHEEIDHSLSGVSA